MAIIGLVQRAQSQFAGSGAKTQAFGSGVTKGNLLMAVITGYQDATLNFTVTDSLGQTWTQAALSRSGSGLVALYYFANTAAGSCTVTVTANESYQYVGIMLSEFAGLATTGVLDAAATSNGGSEFMPFAVPAAVTAGNTDLSIVAFEQSSANLSWVAVDGPYTLLNNLTQGRIGGNPSAGGASAYGVVQAATGAQFVLDQSVFDATLTVTFKGAASAVSPPIPNQAPVPRVHTQDKLVNRSINQMADMLNALCRRGQLARQGDADWAIQT